MEGIELPPPKAKSGASRGMSIGDCCCSPITLGCYVVLLLAVFSVSMACITDVPPLNYGLKYNAATKDVSPDVYDSGRFFILPWESFIMFPSTARNMDFTDGLSTPFGYIASGGPMKIRIDEALEVSLHFSVQYQLQRDNLYQLYKKNSIHYEDNIYVSTVRDELEDMVGELNLTDLWKKREENSVKMQHRMQKALDRQYANCLGVQLLNINLQRDIEGQFVRTQVATQKKETRHFEGTARNVRKSTEIEASVNAASITMIEAEANAEVIKIEGDATETITRLKLETLREKSAYAKSQLGFTNPQLLTYEELRMQSSQQDASFVVNFETASVRVGPGC